MARDMAVKRALLLRHPKLEVHDFNGFLLWEPTEVPAPDAVGVKAHPDMTAFSEAWLSLPPEESTMTV